MEDKFNSIQTLHLPTLLYGIENNIKWLLYKIDSDDKLKKRQMGDLVIANVSNSLNRPKYQHQLFAKGIVYKRNPYELISFPLMKMYNYSMQKVSDRLADELAEKAKFQWLEKLDGTMIQAFEYQGEDYLSTRGVVEGMMESKYLGKAREEFSLEPKNLKDKTLIYELVSKDIGLTRYETQKLVLLSIYDHSNNRYRTFDEVESFANRHGIDTPDILLDKNELESGIDELQQELKDDPKIPEGAVLTFEDWSGVLHRVKIKTEKWLNSFKLKHDCTFKNTVQTAWEKDITEEWQNFKSHLKETGMVEEEFVEDYREHFAEWREHVEKAGEIMGEVHTLLEDYYDENGPLSAAEDRSEYNKQLALTFKEHEYFHLVMEAHRNGIEMRDVLMYFEPYEGFRGFIKSTS